MYKIFAPNKAYTGVSAGVAFVNGVGETDKEHLIYWFKSKGYEVVGAEPEPEPEPEAKENTEPDPNPDIEPEKPENIFTLEILKTKTREDLMKIAKEKNLNVPHNIGEETLINKILEV